MKVISVNGYKHSGKTTICEALIKTLRARGYSVASCKEIYDEKYLIDADASRNTRRHRDAGSQFVIGRMPKETDVMIPRRLSISELLSYFDTDYVILESVRDCLCPRIIASKTTEDIAPHNVRAIAISGIISNTDLKEFEGLPVINPFTNAEELADLVEKYAFEPLPNLSKEQCGRCGFDCHEMCNQIISGNKNRDMCVYHKDNVSLINNGETVLLDDMNKNQIRKVLAETLGISLDAQSIDIVIR